MNLPAMNYNPNEDTTFFVYLPIVAIPENITYRIGMHHADQQVSGDSYWIGGPKGSQMPYNPAEAFLADWFRYVADLYPHYQPTPSQNHYDIIHVSLEDHKVNGENFNAIDPGEVMNILCENWVKYDLRSYFETPFNEINYRGLEITDVCVKILPSTNRVVVGFAISPTVSYF